MSKKELCKRYLLFVISLFFIAVGVALTKRSALGVSPISSVANMFSLKYTFLTMGNWLLVWNCILIIGQIAVLRKNFKLYQLLQLPLSLIFGCFTDFGMLCVSFIPVTPYIMRLAMVFAGVVFLGFGVALSVIADVIMNSAEAFVKAVSDVTGKIFGNVKVAFDVACVIISVVLSLVFFDMRVVETREGTLIAAVCTGFVVKFFCKRLKNPLDKILLK